MAMVGGDSLANLRDLHLPKAIAWWPPAPGWYVVFLLLVILLCWGGARLLIYKNRLQRRKKALQLVATLEREFNPEMGAEIMSELSQLLKRLAFSQFSRERIATLKGEAWLDFLAETAHNPDFKAGPGRLLLSAPYKRTASTECRAVFPLVKHWIEINL